MAEVFAAGTRLHVCGAALQEHQIDPATLPVYTEIVAGRVALVPAQAAAFAYVRPWHEVRNPRRNRRRPASEGPGDAARRDSRDQRER
jgi:hypothetical protein